MLVYHKYYVKGSQISESNLVQHLNMTLLATSLASDMILAIGSPGAEDEHTVVRASLRVDNCGGTTCRRT